MNLIYNIMDRSRSQKYKLFLKILLRFKKKIIFLNYFVGKFLNAL